MQLCNEGLFHNSFVESVFTSTLDKGYYRKVVIHYRIKYTKTLSVMNFFIQKFLFIAIDLEVVFLNYLLIM